MTLTIKKIWPVLLVVSFVLHREVTSIEVNTILLLVLTSFVVLLNKGKMIKRDFDVLSLLLLIICIGSFTAIFNKPSAYNFIRDLLYFTKPVLLILLGYFLTRLINDWKVVFKALIYLGVGYAVYHILHFVIFTNFNHPHIISHIRGVNGLSNIIEVFSIALIVLGNKYKEYSIFSKKSTK